MIHPVEGTEVMDVNRREFLGGIFAALLLPKVVAAKPARFYDHSEWTGFKTSPSSTKLIGCFWAHRNDGEYFCCYVPLELEDVVLIDYESVDAINYASQRLLDGALPQSPLERLLLSKTEAGRLRMETYLNPACRCSAKVLGWKTVKTEDGDEYRVPIHTECGIHPEVWK